MVSPSTFGIGTSHGNSNPRAGPEGHRAVRARRGGRGRFQRGVAAGRLAAVPRGSAGRGIRSSIPSVGSDREGNADGGREYRQLIHQSR